MPVSSQRSSLRSRIVAAMRAASRHRAPREVETLRASVTGGALGLQPDAIAIVRRDGGVLAGNAAAARLSDGAALADALSAQVAAVLADGVARRAEIELAVDHGTELLDGTIAPTAEGAAALVVMRNVTRERRIQQALAESRQRYKDLVEISSDFSWETDADGKFAFVSPQGAFGYSAAELLARMPRSLLAETNSDLGVGVFSTRERVVDAELWLRCADGTNALVRASALPVLAGAGDWTGARGVCRDITRERERESTLARAEMRERLIAYVIRTIHDETDPASVLEAAAAATGRSFGAEACRIYIAGDDRGLAVTASFGRDQIGGGEAALLAEATRQGATRSAKAGGSEIVCVATRHRKTVNGAFVLVRAEAAGPWAKDDVALAEEVAPQLATAIEQFKDHARLEALSRTDELTKLLNRRAFLAELAQRLGRNAPAALFFVDLDNFKRVNDVHGHQRGDQALLAVADLLRANTRAGDLVARLGGDEFAVWLDRADATAAVQRVEQLLSASAGLGKFSGDSEHPLGVSIGVAVVAARSDETVEQITARADEAMYAVKRRAKGNYAVSTPDGAICEPKPRAVERARA
jgi:diguanylate cyclase (GGDEF)-like protein/PAS domain S-box-containing protein